MEQEFQNRTAASGQFPAVDIIKFLCAILVVAIHTSPLGSYFGMRYGEIINYGIVEYAARIAVPFYFSVSGYFLFRKIDLTHFDSSVTKAYLFRILRLLGIWTILLVAGSQVHLWYLGGVAAAVVLLTWLLKKKVSLKAMSVLALILYLFGLLGSAYYGLLTPLKAYPAARYFITCYDTVFQTTRNGIFMGFPFLLLGGIVEKSRLSIRPIWAAAGFGVSMLALLAEAAVVRSLWLAKGWDMYLCLLPVTFFLLSLALGWERPVKEIHKKLRVIGELIFFIHQFVYQCICWFFEALNHFTGFYCNDSLLFFVLTVVVSVLLSTGIEALSRSERFSFLKYLYA